jgi:hypothetical protein
MTQATRRSVLAAAMLAVGLVAGLASLGFASALVGTVGLAGAAFYARFVPETLRQHQPTPALSMHAEPHGAAAEPVAGG